MISFAMNSAERAPAPDSPAGAPEPLTPGRGAKPLRLPVWKCPRCGARKRLRGARHG